MDQEDALRIALEKDLPPLQQYWGTPLRIDLEDTDEYEWGWMFSFEPVAPESQLHGEAKLAYGQILVDRLTGHSVVAGTSGPVWAIERLLKSRPEADRAGLLGYESLGGLVRGFLNSRAIHPIRRGRPDDDDE